MYCSISGYFYFIYYILYHDFTGAMDSFARGLLNAAAMLEAGVLEKNLNVRHPLSDVQQCYLEPVHGYLLYLLIIHTFDLLQTKSLLVHILFILCTS